MSLVENTAIAVEAHFMRRPVEGPWLRVVVREQSEVVHPLTGKAIRRPPISILKQGSRTLAMLVGELLIVSRAAPRCVRMPLVREARERLFDYETLNDRQIAELAS
jgi:hypothetical protein